MAIEFRCPQGHLLRCPDEQAGRRAKCPKCGAVVQVPASGVGSGTGSNIAREARDVTAADSGVALGSGVGKGSGVSLGSGVARAADPTQGSGLNRVTPTEGRESPAKARKAKEPSFSFLCPNGHQLHCPVRMQGKPGKCPHCGVKFIIPNEDEEEESRSDDEPIAYDEGSGKQSGSAPPPLAGARRGRSEDDEITIDVGDLAMSFPAPAARAPRPVNGVPASPASPAPDAGLPQLLAFLWKQKGERGVLEVYLRGGEKIIPHGFSSRLSQETSATFYLRDQDGRFTVTVINWDAIERIALGGVDQLPGGMFE